MFLHRLGRLRQTMADQAVDALIVPVGSDLFYLSGYAGMVSERLTALVVPVSGDPVLLIPELEAPRVGEGPFNIRPWRETEDSVQVAAELLGRPGRLAVGDQLWSVFLLGLQELMPGTEFLPASSVTTLLRVRKEREEIDLLRAAGQAADRVVEELRRVRFSGRAEADLAREIASLTVESGHDQASFWIVASGPNSASPHHEPGRRVIDQSDLVVVDFGGKVDGYGSDCTRTFSVGEPTPDQREVHAVVLAAQRAAFAEVRPGVPAEHVDFTARSIIADAGYGEHFIHRTGHGIGLDGHEHPYLVEGNREPLEAGMCFSIEPGIYLPGRFGVRIEDIVTVTAEGGESLNQAERSLVLVE